MSWLFGQVWLWYLAAFLVGLLLAWLVFVRPQQRRLKALLLRSLATLPAAAPTGSSPATDPAGAAPTESIPVVEPDTEPSAEAPTDAFPAVDPALNTLDTARLVAADAPTPPHGTPTVPAPPEPEPPTA